MANEATTRKEFNEDINYKASPNNRFEGANKSNSPKSSRSRKFSNSPSRSGSKNRKRDIRKKRSNSKSRSPSLSNSRGFRSGSETKNVDPKNVGQKGPALNFQIFLTRYEEEEILKGQVLKKVKFTIKFKIEDQLSDVKMYFDYDFTIPELNGCVLNIKSDDLKKKKEATQQIFDYIVKNNLDSGEDEERRGSDKLNILIMVPNGLVSMIIGTKGRQISKLMKDSQANIVVNQPIYKMMHRTVSISGKNFN